MARQAFFKTSVTYKGWPLDAPKSVSKAKFTRAARKGKVNATEVWHSRFLPRHFTAKGAALYRYKRRSARYLRRKDAMRRRPNSGWVGTRNTPLVMRGTLRLNAMSGIKVTVRRKSGRVSGAMTVPQHTFFKNKNGPDKEKELVTTARGESKVIAEVIQKTIDRQVSKGPRRRVKKL